MELDRSELAWAAGFFDGEGCTSLQDRRRLIVGVVQADVRPLERFRAAVGGIGTINPRSNRSPEHLGRKQMWGWWAQNFEHAQAVLAMLWPFLCEPKREQALIALGRVRDVRATWPLDHTMPGQKLTAVQRNAAADRVLNGETAVAVGMDIGVTSGYVSRLARERVA